MEQRHENVIHRQGIEALVKVDTARLKDLILQSPIDSGVTVPAYEYNAKK